VSNGSGTETRYGRGAEPHSSAIDAVLPPEVEKKKVVATAPPLRTTRPAVASTAAFEDVA